MRAELKGGRDSAGSTLFPKSVRVNAAVPLPGAEGQKVQKLPSAWPSSNLLLMSQECSFHARFHLGLSIHCYEFLFITAIGRKSKGI